MRMGVRRVEMSVALYQAPATASEPSRKVLFVENAVLEQHFMPRALCVEPAFLAALARRQARVHILSVAVQLELAFRSFSVASKACVAIVTYAHVTQAGTLEAKPQSDTLPSYPTHLAHFLSALALV